MAADARLPPTWLMGAGFLPLGVSGAVMLLTTPQLLAGDHVPEPVIATVTAIALSPSFLSFALAPMLDWRFSRKAYAIVFAAVGGLCSFAALLAMRQLFLLTLLLFIGNMAISLGVAAVGGWFGNLTETERKGRLGAWFTVYNIAGGGIASAVAIPLLRDLPYAVGAAVLGLGVVSALPLYILTPCPPADGRLARESFSAFAREVLALLRQPTVLWTLLLFLLPSASFALTNILGGVGQDFHTSERLVALIGGAGVAIAGVFGSLLVPPLANLVPPRPLYLLIGIAGAAFSLLLVILPRTPLIFGLAELGENVFQAAAFATGYVIILRTIGQNNPLAATQFGLLLAATCLPLTYMQTLDGQGYAANGLAGAFITDAGLSGGVCILLAMLFWALRRRIPKV
jgi:PAT family beta-lactamase induction signal transducer AmpG